MNNSTLAKLMDAADGLQVDVIELTKNVTLEANAGMFTPGPAILEQHAMKLREKKDNLKAMLSVISTEINDWLSGQLKVTEDAEVTANAALSTAHKQMIEEQNNGGEAKPTQAEAV